MVLSAGVRVATLVAPRGGKPGPSAVTNSKALIGGKMEKTELAGLLACEDTPYRQVVTRAVEDFLGTKTEAFGKLGTASLAEILLPRDVDLAVHKRLCTTMLSLAKDGKMLAYTTRGAERDGKGPMKGKTVRPWLWHGPTEPAMVLPIAVSREPSQLDRIEEMLKTLLTRG